MYCFLLKDRGLTTYDLVQPQQGCKEPVTWRLSSNLHTVLPQEGTMSVYL